MLIAIVSFIVFISIVLSCPPKENLFPCECDFFDATMYVKCKDVQNDDDLLNGVASLNGYYIYSFTIQGAFLNYLPHDLFKGIRITELEFLDSSITEFSDTDVAFEGLEDWLEILTISDCDYMNEWDWSLLRNMKKLMRLDINGGDMLSIDETVKGLSGFKLKEINFSRNKISDIYDYAFANCTELQHLILSENEIENVRRSMLPNPAPNLLQIDLGYNKILRLPEDFFVNMPSLITVGLIKNKILTLDEKTFAPVWGQLENFQAMNNPLRCDCLMAWILKTRMPPDMRAVCNQPRRLKGRNLATLKSKELWC